MKGRTEELFIRTDSTIREAMQTITDAAHKSLPVGITLVVENDELKGTVTDGDIRKALVKGASLDDSVSGIMAENPITVSNDLSVDEMIASIRTKVKDSGRISDTKVDKVIVTDSSDKVVEVLDFYDLWFKQDERFKSICIVGTGFVGLTLAVSMAESGHQILGYDVNSSLVDQLNEGQTDFYEKGLSPLLNLHLREKNLNFVDSLKDTESDVYMLCVGTPVDQTNHEPSLSSIQKASAAVGEVLRRNDLVILRSTVPVGTTRDVVLPILEEKSGLKAGVDFYLAFAPERVVEGKALDETKDIPQVIGGLNKESTQEASRVFQTLNASVVLLDSLEEAEMVKLLNNSFRDLSFAFANNIALLCGKLGLDTVKIIKAANEGYPRNRIALPSPGVGGYCLTKDPHLLAAVAKRIDEDATMFINGRDVNERMHSFVVDKVDSFRSNNKLDKIKVFILGFAFKGYPLTSDIRGSSTLAVIKELKDRFGNQIDICGYDPVVSVEQVEDQPVAWVDYSMGFKDADCVLIMNNNPEFSELDIYAFLDTMNKPGMLFDGWSFFKPNEVSRVKGITYEGLGGGY